MLSIDEWDDRYLKRLAKARDEAAARALATLGKESTALLGGDDAPGSQNFGTISRPPPVAADSLPPILEGENESLLTPSNPTISGPINDNNVVPLEEGYESNLESANSYQEDLAWRKLWEYDKTLFFKRVIHRAPYYVFPIALWLPKYSWKRDFLSDLVAGIGVGCMVVPQALAYAIIAGVPPVMGLYTAMFPLVVFGAMTTSKHMHFGPDALASLLVGLTMLAPQYADEDKAELASIFSFICGLTLLAMGIFRFGFLDNILSRPLLSGFVNAVAIIIFVNQLEPFLGLPASNAEQAWQKVIAVFSNIEKTHLMTVMFGSCCLAILITLRVLKWRFDQTRFLNFGFDLESHGVKILRDFPSSIPIPSIPDIKSLDLLQIYAVDAAIICIVGFVETIVVVKIYASKHNYSVSPNRELVAMGAANVVGAFFHTFPAFGSLTRSAMGDFLGAKSQLFTFISAIVVLLTILFLGPVVYFLPRVTMSAIIMTAAYSLVEVHDLVFLWRLRAWKEIGLLLTTFVITLLAGVDLGIFIGIGISVLFVIAHTSVPHITVLGKDSRGSWTDASRDPTVEMNPSTLVVRIEEALYFANIEQIKGMFKRIEIFGSHRAHPTARPKSTVGSLKNIIVHCKNITEMDASAVETVYEMTADYQKRDIFICFVKLRPEIAEKFARAGVIGGDLGGDRNFNSVDDAVAYVKTRDKRRSSAVNEV